MPEVSTPSKEKYQELRGLVQRGQIAHWGGRSAQTLEELDRIIQYAKNTTRTEEEGNRRLAEAAPFAGIPGLPGQTVKAGVDAALRKELNAAADKVSALERVVDGLVQKVNDLSAQLEQQAAK